MQSADLSRMELQLRPALQSENQCSLQAYWRMDFQVRPSTPLSRAPAVAEFARIQTKVQTAMLFMPTRELRSQAISSSLNSQEFRRMADGRTWQDALEWAGTWIAGGKSSGRTSEF